MKTDQELVVEYAVSRSEAAFAELVERHKDWVYSSCLRRLGDTGLAEDATQAVFISLARKAGALRGHKSLAGWLYTAARFTALNTRKVERRRAAHEAEVAQMVASEKTDDAAEMWGEIGPRLESALDRLPEKYRLAVLLRFYQKKSYGEIGQSLGISEENARKRVERGVEKLRGRLIPAGSGSAMSAAILTHGVGRAPAGISAPATAQHVAAASGASWTLSSGVLQMMYWAKVKMMAAACGVLVLVTGATVAVVAESREATLVRADAAAVTTAPAADPMQTLEAINKAFAECDAEALPQVLLTDDAQEKAAVAAVQERFRIVKKLRTVLTEKGMAEGEVTRAAQDLTGGVPFKQKELDNTISEVKGDTAVMTRLDRPQSTTTLRRVNGKWKVDLHSVMKDKKGLDELAAQLTRENPIILELQKEVEKGDLLPEELLRRFNNATGRTGGGMGLPPVKAGTQGP